MTRSTPITSRGRAGTHVCPGGCGRSVVNIQFACRSDWYRLPVALRKPITEAYLKGTAGIAEHQAAMAEAMQWYAKNPRTSR